MLSVAEKVSAFRAEMEKEHITAYYIPTNDFHGSEYVCDHFKCREYLSGFTGSAGTLVITKDFAGLWTDGRYFIQAANQLQDTEIQLMKMNEPGVLSVEEYLVKTLSEGDVLGFDGRCVSADFTEKLKEQFSLEGKSITINSHFDLVDRVWKERPAISFHPVWELSANQAGYESAAKIADIRKEMEKVHASAHLVTSLEDIAWILNLRGNDVHCNPVFLSYLYITKNECLLFADEHAMKDISWSGLNDVKLLPYEEIYDFVKTVRGQNIVLDNRIVNTALVEALTENGNTFLFQPNPSEKMKAVKNETELRNIREAHIYDGVAVTKFLFFLKNYRDAVLNGIWTEPLLTEMQLAEILLKYRKRQKLFLEESFDPIMAYGANGAIVHYSATKETDTKVGTDNLLLFDTGAHYFCGTTDITRTVLMAEPDCVTSEQKKHYTLVLKAHLRLLDAKFPKGVTGNSLDAIAREPL
ncbi:MAG: aminopeptidase P family N-terminal domain-containing protein, partial [Lachnospiraceae bacterium]|nr:aminopeptidase P family N-terminal domain-containing protein [Lachnospiraceae bacterium]